MTIIYGAVYLPDVPVGNTFARCTLCSIDFGVYHGGRSDIAQHVRSKRHIESDKAASTSRSLASVFQPQTSEKVIEAEVRWATFVAKHNLAFLSSDHATKLFSSMFPDSEIAKKFACGRTKTTAIVKQALAPHYTQKVIQNMSNPFSIMMDESNDKTDKSCIILVRVLDPEVGDICTRFLDMPDVNVGTAANLFDALKSSLVKHGLDFNSTIAFMSDTTNVMKGARSGVQKLIKNEHPFLYDVGCICHLADLTVEAGLKGLPIDIDQLFIDVFYYFQHSSKRKQEFVDLWCSLFTGEPEVILKHCPTRWLSLLRCVDRYLTQYDGLKSYFLSCGEAETVKVRNILSKLEHPLTRPLLHFLSFILPSVDKFNRAFQKSTESTTPQLFDEMCRLVRLYAANFLTRDSIIAAGDNLCQLKFDVESQVSNENLGIGSNTWACISDLESTHDLRPFFVAVRTFYVNSTKKMLNKFPFHDTLMKDLSVLHPEKAASFPVSKIVGLAKRFPQIGLTDSVEIDKLSEEFLDFTISPSDLPSIVKYKSADGTMRPRAGLFWSEVGKMTTLDGQPRFNHLHKLMAGLLSIPVSNADSERGFSMLRKIHTDQRSNLQQSTIVALMAMKFNCDDCCHEIKLPKELLSKSKKATSVQVSQRASK